METSGFTPPPEPPKANPWLMLVLLLGIFALIFGVSLGPIHIGPVNNRQSRWTQEAHVLGIALYSYANDNNQMYPDGSSSTEVFQKLLDGGYVTDPTLYYIPMPGKVKPVAGQKLKPENVCWDITAPVDSSTPLPLPLIFMTGYKVNYAPGGAATPLNGVPPQYEFEDEPRTWLQRLFGKPDYKPSDGIAVFYVNNSAAFHIAAPDGSIPNFVPPDFQPDGKTYHQLTPDGVLR